MSIPMPDPGTLALAGGALGQIAHIVKKRRQEKPNESEWQTLKRWVFGNPLNTLGAVLANATLVAACPIPEIATWLQAIALFSTYFTSGMGCNSAINRKGPAEEGSVQEVVEEKQAEVKAEISGP